MVNLQQRQGKLLMTGFTQTYFRKRKYLAWRAPIVCSAIKRALHPTSVIDFGCSIGDLVWSFNEMGVPTIGFDVSPNVFHYSNPECPIIIHDITQPLPTQSKFDLAICIEVIRFIPELDLPGLIENFSTNATRVLIGYGGERIGQVIYQMEYHGWKQKPIDRLTSRLEQWKHKPAIKALYHGALYFE
jgi:hypothetical protein